MSSPSESPRFGVAEAKRTDREVLADDLYREIILDHYSNPRHRGRLGVFTHRQEGINPTCGDAIVLDLVVEDGRVKDVGFTGQGCSISIASASMMTEMIQGMTLAQVQALAGTFKGRMLTRCELADAEIDIGELEALDGVRNYPLRIKCALLAWNTLLQALQEQSGKEST